MAELKFIHEYLQTDIGTEGQLLIPRMIHATLIAAVDKALIPRSEAAIVFGPANIPGSSIDVDYEVANTFKVREVGEGSEYPLARQEYNSFNLKPKKYGGRIVITREMIEDAKWPLLTRNIEAAGKALADNETRLIISDALDNAANTVAGGASVTIPNITQAMYYLEESDYEPTTYFVGNAVLQDLRNIDTFVEFSKSGDTEMLDRGFKGVLYGLKVIKVSTNAGMTTTTSFVTDRKNAYVIAEKRAITTEGFEIAANDMSGTVVSQRIGARHLFSSAICKITSS